MMKRGAISIGFVIMAGLALFVLTAFFILGVGILDFLKSNFFWIMGLAIGYMFFFQRKLLNKLIRGGR